MTVAELIKHLEQFPPEATVLTSMCSESITYNEDDIVLIEEKKRFVLHEGQYIRYRASYFDFLGQKPQFVYPVVYFKGN